MFRKIVLVFVVALGLTACGKKEVKKLEIPNEKDTSDLQKKDEKELHRGIVIYKVVSEDEVIIKKEVSCDDWDKDTLWSVLKKENIVENETEVLSLKQVDTTLYLDVNEAFGNQLRTQGASGERALLTCVVNTYLQTYECEKIKITEEGQSLCSGHAEYDDYLKMMEYN